MLTVQSTKKFCSNEEHYSTELCGKVLTLDSEL